MKLVVTSKLHLTEKSLYSLDSNPAPRDLPKKLALVIKKFSRRTNHAQRFNSTTDATATEENDAAASEENDDNATEENNATANEENDDNATEENDATANEENDDTANEENDTTVNEENDDNATEENDATANEENNDNNVIIERSNNEESDAADKAARGR